MGFFDKENHVASDGEASAVKDSNLKEIEVKLPGENTKFVLMNKHQARRVYSDEMKKLIIIIDEYAEFSQMSSGTSQNAKDENAMKQQCIELVTSITQLGRAGGIHMLLATQRNDARIISGQIQNNTRARMVCGKPDMVASLMAFGNGLGTTVNGSIEGAGMISMQQKMDHIQYYYPKSSWIHDWYKDRGLDEHGYDPIQNIQEVEKEVLEGIEEIESNREKITMSFDDISKEIDKTEDQRFTEI